MIEFKSNRCEKCLETSKFVALEHDDNKIDYVACAFCAECKHGINNM